MATDPRAGTSHPSPRWKNLLRPRVVLPVLISAALLVFAFSFVDLGKVAGRIGSLSAGAVAGCAGLAGAYFALKGLELRIMLRALGSRASGKATLAAYAVGEVAILLPAGVYSQNWALSRIDGGTGARSAGATTVMVVAEMLVVLAVLGASGIPGWPWLQPAALALLAVMIGLVIIVVGTDAPRSIGRRLESHERWGPPVRAARSLLGGMRDLARPRVLAVVALLTCAYLACLVEGLLVVAHGMGIEHIDYRQVLTIYFVSLAAALFGAGLVSQLGSVEAVGLTAAGAWGFAKNTSLAMLVGFRIVWISSIWAICAVVLIALRRELCPRDASSAEDDGHEPLHRFARPPEPGQAGSPCSGRHVASEADLR